jgi:hypothetical protein
MFWLNSLMMAAGCWISWPRKKGGVPKGPAA